LHDAGLLLWAGTLIDVRILNAESCTSAITPAATGTVPSAGGAFA